MTEKSSHSLLARVPSPLIDVFASSVAAALSTLVGHPLDTIKLRIQIQTQTHKPSLFQVFRDIRANEGVSPLYF